MEYYLAIKGMKSCHLQPHGWAHLYVKSEKQMSKHNKRETVIDTENNQVVARGEVGVVQKK